MSLKDRVATEIKGLHVEIIIPYVEVSDVLITLVKWRSGRNTVLKVNSFFKINKTKIKLRMVINRSM